MHDGHGHCTSVLDCRICGCRGIICSTCQVNADYDNVLQSSKEWWGCSHDFRKFLWRYNRRERRHSRIPKSLKRKLCSMFQSVDIRGKSGHQVLVLLNDEMVRQLITLVDNQSATGMNESNTLLFVLPSNSLKGYCGQNVCPLLSGVCALELITSTKL